ncbi:MAG: glycosyltransferase family 4 protein [Planctomycetales bacterium]|nr:glycosyltransferase family 4 protein [Planctomycetales bacterium]MBN8625598.1 glycosyltransferase family 4 protein [Planctomycetota bacterium]
MLGLLGQLRQKHTVSLLVMADGPLCELAVSLGIPVRVVPLPCEWLMIGEQQAGAAQLARMLLWRGYKLGGYVRELRTALRGLSPEIVHTHGIKAHLTGAMAKPDGAKLVWHVQDYLSIRRLSRRLLQLAVRRADLAFACSESVGVDVQECFPRLPVAVVPNPTDCEHFRPGSSQVDFDFIAGLAPATGTVVRVGLVATYAVWKGHRLFLDAMSRIVARFGSGAVRGYVVGGPIYRTAGRSQVTAAELVGYIKELKLNRVVGLVPFQADPVEAYRVLDVCVHASTAPEPFGLTITEAMACGRAVVAANAGGPAEIITHERDGLLYELGNPDALAEAIIRLIENAALRDQLGNAARETVTNRFQLSTATAKLLSTYQSLLGERASTD